MRDSITGLKEPTNSTAGSTTGYYISYANSKITIAYVDTNVNLNISGDIDFSGGWSNGGTIHPATDGGSGGGSSGGDTGGTAEINWEQAMASAQPHPEQDPSNEDIGIDANGDVCNLDLWRYDKDYENDSAAMLGCDSQDPWECYLHAYDWTEPTDLVLVQYIKFSDEDFFRPVGYLSGDSFADFNLLRSVVFPSTLKRVGSNVFGGCSSLYSLTIPEGIEAWDTGSDNTSMNPGLPGTLYIDSEPCCASAYNGSALEDPGCLQRVCIKSDYYNSGKDTIVWYSNYLNYILWDEVGDDWKNWTDEEYEEFENKSYVRFEYTGTSNGYAVYERVAESGE